MKKILFFFICLSCLTTTAALMHAVETRDLSRAQYLLNQGADVNCRNHTGATALMIAALYGNLDMVKLLVRYGADINATEGGATVFFYAQRHPAIFQFLRDFRKEYFKRKIVAAESPAQEEGPKRNLYELRKTSLNQSKEIAKSLLNPKISKRFILEHSSASEFSGALEWAHRQGILGKDTHLLVLEADGYDWRTTDSHPDLEGRIEGFKDMSEHAVSVASVVEETAPQARIFVSRNNELEDPSLKPDVYREFLENFSDNTIINASLGVIAHDDFQKTQDLFLKLLLEKNNLLINSAGNRGVDIETTLHGSLLKGLFATHPSLKNRIIIAGGTSSSSGAADFSNKPGSQKDFQDRFLFTLGKNIAVRKKNEEGYGAGTGTSYAAPSISGVAALLLSTHQDFSMEEIATVLLESAEKNFFIPNLGSGHSGTFVCDEEFFRTHPRIKGDEKNSPPDYVLFDPALYGRGLLSVRRAFLYASIYAGVRKNLRLSMEEKIKETTRIFSKRIKDLDDFHVKKIQRGFRNR